MSHVAVYILPTQGERGVRARRRRRRGRRIRTEKSLADPVSVRDRLANFHNKYLMMRAQPKRDPNSCA